MINKKSYFQGTEEPTPKKKKYKSEPAILIQPRFKEPFYKNYDVYNVPGNHDTPVMGPGAGWHEIMKYKSISDFLKAKRKHIKDKYKADDFWIEDSHSNREERKARMRTRARLLARICKIAIDFPIDDQTTPILGESGTYSDSVPIGGETDEYLPHLDFEGKSPDKLDFGRDYANDVPIDMNAEITQIISPAESDLLGLPDGIDLTEDETLLQPTNQNRWYGITNTHNPTFNFEVDKPIAKSPNL